MLYIKDFWYYLLSAPGAICALGLHEYVKARASFRQGDPLPRRRGRLRANPFSHMDPAGVIAMLLTGYGWARPVPVSSTYYADRRRGTLITFVLPILASVIACCAVASLLAVYKLYLQSSAAPPFTGVWNVNFQIYRAVFFFARANLAVALLNILPIYPLDGSAILAGFLPANGEVKLAALEKPLQLFLLLLLATGVVGMAFDPVINALLKFVIF